MRAQAQRAIDAKTKPLGALGRLEEIAVRLAVVQNTLTPDVSRSRICVFGADHGIADEGVSAYPKAVTAEMMRNFAAGGAAINVLARANGVDVEVIDVGVDADLSTLENLHHAKVRRGTSSFLQTAAMTNEDVAAAMEVGANAIRRAVSEGVRAVGFGEMGIGNTTSAAALLAALVHQSASVTVGRGTGVSGEALTHKRAVVDRALALHASAGEDAREWLRRVGGLEIAAIAGATIEAASSPIVLVADGFISTVGVLAGLRILPADRAAVFRDSLFFAHRSTEVGHTIALDACAALGVDSRPLLELEMRLGEGTGAALAMPILRWAAAVLCEMATFASADVSTGDHSNEHSA